MCIELEERGVDTNGMGIGCPHTNRSVFYLSMELLFCEDCIMQVIERMVKDYAIWGIQNDWIDEMREEFGRWRAGCKVQTIADKFGIDIEGLIQEPPAPPGPLGDKSFKIYNEIADRWQTDWKIFTGFPLQRR